MNQTFNVEAWLATQKKGIGGKVSREIFITKMKELGAEIEQLKQDKNQLSTKNEELETKLKTSQTDLNSRDQIIKDKDKEIGNLKNSSEQSEQKIKEDEEKIKELEAELKERYKTIEELEKEVKNREEEIKNLQQNQEKHRPEELKPDNLPNDWEKQLEDKKKIEVEFKGVQKKLSETENKLKEAEKRPAQVDLDKVIQQETEKYKDYVKLTPQEQEKLRTYESLKAEVGRLEEELANLSPHQPAENNSEEIIKKVGELFAAAINPLRIEIAELLKKQSTNNIQPTNPSTELPADYKEIKAQKEDLLRALKLIGSKIEK